jgi:hypothetical protein
LFRSKLNISLGGSGVSHNPGGADRGMLYRAHYNRCFICLFQQLTVDLDEDHLMLWEENDEGIFHYNVQVLDNNVK